MSWIFTTSSAAIFKAGKNASTTATLSGAILDKWSDEIESSLCMITRRDWISEYPTISGSNYVKILGDTETGIIAQRIINYDMSGFTSRIEAQTMMDLLRDEIMRNLDSLKDTKNKELI